MGFNHAGWVARITWPPGREQRHFASEAMMKKTAVVILFATLLAPLSMFGDDAKTTFEAKCKMCHGANLEKKPIDTTKAEADLVKFLTTDSKHKAKVADEAQAKALVTYIKSLKK
jgi:hypothetical protein